MLEIIILNLTLESYQKNYNNFKFKSKFLKISFLILKSGCCENLAKDIPFKLRTISSWSDSSHSWLFFSLDKNEMSRTDRSVFQILWKFK